MRLLVFWSLTVGIVTIFLSLAPGQDNTGSAQKYVWIAPQNATRPVKMEARSIERGLPYPSLVTLKGNVLIQTPVCLPVGQQGAAFRFGARWDRPFKILVNSCRISSGTSSGCRRIKYSAAPAKAILQAVVTRCEDMCGLPELFPDVI